MKKSSPAYTMRGRSKDQSSLEVPGPGSYNPNLTNLDKSPNYKIGTSDRLSSKLSWENPGPGSYDPKQSAKLSPRAVIGKSKRGKTDIQEITPGPGSYENEVGVGGPKYSMKGNKLSNSDNYFPGPGSYTPRQEFSKTMVPSYAIGKAKRMISQESRVPGPGSYNSGETFHGPKWKVGTQKRLVSKFEEIPGPGAYESMSEHSQPAYTMRPKRPVTSGSAGPGPGAYSPRETSSSINYSIGQSERNCYKLNEVPGPASYETATPKTRSAFFGSGQRAFSIGEDKNPGPGNYENLVPWQGPKYSMRKKNKNKDFDEFPGPGNYNPKQVFKAEPAWKVGNEKRIPEKNNRNPGPGSYGDKSSLSGPKWAFTRTSRAQKSQESFPGPGTYEIKATIPDVPAYLMASVSSNS